MTRRKLFSLALAAAVTAGLAIGCKDVSKPHVLLISLDGFRWDYRERFDTPVLDAIAAAGVSAEKLQPAFPSKTFPNHFTLVTGLVPDHHGIISNTMRDPAIPGVTFSMSNREAVVDARWWQVEPIWTELEKLGKRTAPLLWPGSEAPIGGVMPDHWTKYEQSLTDDQRLDMLAALFERPESEWPDFATMYWHAVDTESHRSGPLSDGTRNAAEQVDRAVGRLLQRLRAAGAEGLNVIVVSDHGMSQLSPDRAIYLEDYIDLSTVSTIDSSPNIAVFPVSASVDDVYARLSGKHPHLKIYRPVDFPARMQFGTNPRVPPIYAMADDGWTVYPRRRPGDNFTGGAHGYDNAAESMQGLFVAAGPALKKGLRIEKFRSVDVYELMCAILGVAPKPNDGSREAARALLR